MLQVDRREKTITALTSSKISTFDIGIEIGKAFLLQSLKSEVQSLCL